MRCTNKNEKTIPRERRQYLTGGRSADRRRQRRLIIQFVSLLVVLVLLLMWSWFMIFFCKSHEIDLVRAY